MASRKGANVNLQIDMSGLLQIQRGIVVLDDRLDNRVAAVVARQANITEGWMRSNAPWTDRTGAARSGLSTVTEHVPKKLHAIHMFYRVPYGIWLEVRHAGRYSVIIPALVDQAPKLMATLNRLFAKMGAG